MTTATATQSSQHLDLVPELGIDGITSTCTHTLETTDNYWQTEFVMHTVVRRVVLYLRVDCHGCKLFRSKYDIIKTIMLKVLKVKSGL